MSFQDSPGTVPLAQDLKLPEGDDLAVRQETASEEEVEAEQGDKSLRIWL
jgi:hypothetical protein